MKKLFIVGFIVVLLICTAFAASSLADVVDIPPGVRVIEQGAFYGDTSLEKVVLHEGIERIIADMGRLTLC